MKRITALLLLTLLGMSDLIAQTTYEARQKHTEWFHDASLSRSVVSGDLCMLSLRLVHPVLLMVYPRRHCFNTMIQDLLHILTQPSD